MPLNYANHAIKIRRTIEKTGFKNLKIAYKEETPTKISLGEMPFNY